MGRTPDFVIVGAMRSGTSSLAGYLDSHPDVFITPRKEVHYFNRFYDEGFEWYLAKFADAAGARAVGEATPTYMYDPPAIERMADGLPDARIIAVLREPVSRAYSHYWFNRSRGYESLSFEEALAAEPERLAGADEPTRARVSYFDRGLYAEQLERIAARYPSDRIHVLLFEDLTKKTVETYADVCRFIGVDPAHVPANLGRQVNVHYQRRWPKVNQLAKSLPKPLRTAVRLVNRGKPGPYPPMSEATASELADRYLEPNLRLASYLGRELPEWRVR